MKISVYNGVFMITQVVLSHIFRRIITYIELHLLHIHDTEHTHVMYHDTQKSMIQRSLLLIHATEVFVTDTR